MYKTGIHITVTVTLVTVLVLGGYLWLRYVGTAFPPNAPAPTQPTNLEAYLKVAGIGLTLLTAAMTAIISLVNVIVQVSIARDIERLKPLLTLQYAAYKELNGAAVAVFDALSRLQNERYDVNVAQTADDKLTEASGTLLFMPDKYVENWIAFQQRARFSKEHANALIASLAQGSTYTLEVKDPQGTVLSQHIVSNQADLWLLLQPKLFAAFQKLRAETPH